MDGRLHSGKRRNRAQASLESVNRLAHRLHVLVLDGAVDGVHGQSALVGHQVGDLDEDIGHAAHQFNGSSAVDGII